jgi:hypothetical protein
MREPIRWIQTNLRETDAALEPRSFVQQVADFDANVLLMAMGGISSFYPTKVQFHYQSPYIPAGHDTFGEVLRAAHSRGIRVVGRFDLSKAHKDAYDAHPEWFFKKSNGEPSPYNGLYQACVNGGWYRQKAVEILTEALDRYEVDGLFFNMFSNPSSDYSGNPLGICQCDNCKRLFRERYGRDLPSKPDADYQAFLAESARTMTETIRALIRSKRPDAMLLGTSSEVSDGVFSESNTAVHRPLPLWPYASSLNVNRARNTYPEKMAINQCMSFIDYPWRFSTVPSNEIRIRLWQNVAHGGAAALNMHGTMDQEDRMALDAARPIYRQLLGQKDYYVGQQSAARVLLMARSQNALRGLFRFLSEEHIPFGVADNANWIGHRDVDLVIAAGEVPRELEAWVRNGGHLLLTGTVPPPMDLGKPVKLWKDIQGYFRIRDHAMFPSLDRSNLAFVYGDYLQVDGKSPVTFIPPSMFGPPELVHVDWKDTDAPGLILKDVGKGKVAWLPWDIGGLYYLHSSETHAGLLRDLTDQLLPRGRQLKTNAHPLAEIVFMRQQDRHLVHFINLSGHSQTAYFRPIPMSDIRVEVRGDFKTAKIAGSLRDLPLRRNGEYVEFTLPSLDRYELVELR